MLEIYQVYYGAILVLTFQCVVVAGFNLTSSNSRNKWFALFVFLISHSALRSTLSWPLNNTDLFWWISILSSSQFYGPVLYLFLTSHIQRVNKRSIIKHLSAPAIISVVLFILGLNPQFRESNFYPYFSSIINSVIVLLIVGYTIVGLYRLKAEKWNKILIIVSQKTKIFFFIMGAYLCYSGFYLLIVITFNSSFEGVLMPLNILDLTLYFLVLLVIPIYGISILPWFKKIIQPESISINTDENIDALVSTIDQLFDEEDLHKDSDLTVGKLASHVNISSKDLTLILKNEYQKSFTDFLNQKRVDALKKDLKKPSFDNYDLTSLAKEHGFNSKSTFFRVFKQYTGMTPNEFKKL